MKTGTYPSSEGYIDIRFNLVYSILILLIAAGMAIFAFLSEGDDAILKYLIYAMAFLMLIQGIYSISGRKFIRYDPESKKIKFYGLLGMIERSIKFEKLFFEGNDLYREINGKQKYINLQRYQCNRKDFSAFMDAVNKQP